MNAESNVNPEQTFAQKKLAELLAGKKPPPERFEDRFAPPDIWPEDDIEEFLEWLERVRRGEE